MALPTINMPAARSTGKPVEQLITSPMIATAAAPTIAQRSPTRRTKIPAGRSPMSWPSISMDAINAAIPMLAPCCWAMIGTIGMTAPSPMQKSSAGR